jgi:hypothetical protein
MKVPAMFVLVIWLLLLSITAGRAEANTYCLPGGNAGYETGLEGRIQHVDGLSVSGSDSLVTLTWSPASNVTYYKVYSSSTPNGSFTEDLTGAFNGTNWTAPLTDPRRFYYVTSVTSILTVEAVDQVGGQLSAWVYVDSNFIGYAPLTITNYSPGTYTVWYPPMYPDGSWIWDPSEITLSDNLVDRYLLFSGYYWLK